MLTPDHPRRRGMALLWAAMALEGVVALAGMLATPSEAGSAVLLGLSRMRLLIAGAMLVGIGGLAALALAARAPRTPQAALTGAAKPNWRSRPAAGLRRVGAWWVASPARAFAVFAVLVMLCAGVLAVVILALSPASRELTLLRALLSRAGWLLAWSALILAQLAARLLAEMKAMPGPLITPLRAGLLLAGITAVYTAALRVYLSATWDTGLHGLLGYIFLPALTLLAWGGLAHLRQAAAWQMTLNRLGWLALIGVTTYTLYWHTAQWVHWDSSRDGAVWHLLAQAFLQGRLYLLNPTSTHDLTPFAGHWFVPSPPLPALLLMPFVAVLGLQGVNMVQVAVVCGALNSVLIYLVLTQAAALKMIPTTRAGNLWLTLLLVLGTDHWWLAVDGMFWYLSQLLTLMFALLAALLALRRAHPLWVGACLGLAVMSRPNVFALWLLLAGIALYLDRQAYPQARIPWKRWLGWAAASGAPVCLAVGALLTYNYLRFHNWMDFGYVGVNSAGWIMNAVRTYGMFNLHFLPINLYAMFVKLPFLGLREGVLYYSPSKEGTSLLAMTPAIIYLLRRIKFNAWTVGAWLSIALTMAQLLLYHNTGSWQLGYRYLMDFILPALMLIAVGIGQRPSKVFIGLVLVSVVINAAGIAWWFAHS